MIDALRQGDRPAAVRALRDVDDPAALAAALAELAGDPKASLDVRRDTLEVLAQVPGDVSATVLPAFERATAEELRRELVESMPAHPSLLALAADGKARCSLRAAAATRYWHAGGDRNAVHRLFNDPATPPCLAIAAAPLVQQDLDRGDVPVIAASASRYIQEGYGRTELVELLAAAVARLPVPDANRIDHSMLDLVARPAPAHRRIAALLYLQERGIQAPPDPALLLRVATDDTASEALREAALGAIGSLGRLDPQLTGRLTNFASRPELQPRLRRAAFDALGAVGAAPQRPTLASAATIVAPPAPADLRFEMPRISPAFVLLLLAGLAAIAIYLFKPLLLLKAGLYPRRALDAWIGQHLATARERFEARETVKARTIWVPLPLQLGDERVEADDADDALRALFGQKDCVMLVTGEGGSGKTTLAVKLAQDALAARLTGTPMLPVLLEQDFGVSFLDEIRNELRELTQTDLSARFVRQLLRKKRVLLVVDHFSEMRDATRKQVDPRVAAAVVITSRNDEALPHTAVARPTRVRWSDLTRFMELYLRHKDKLELFSDEEFHEACRHLAEITKGGDSTILTAKLFTDLVVSAKEKKLDILPTSVPDLMLRYVSFINVSRQPSDPDNWRIQRAAKLVAWECLKGELTPTSAHLDDVRRAVGEEDAEELLEYLERDLALIELCEPARTRVRFTLDPLAEYLAALHITEQHGPDAAKWEAWIETLPDNGQKMRGFLRAVLDCIGTGEELDLAREALRLRMTVFAAAA
ncbi:MAG TPA: hypothetical protein VGF69_08560 [Thermoanaerobaculia bacterium]